jgi:hypothetical protein
MLEDQDSVSGSDDSMTQRHVPEGMNSQRLWALKYIIYKNSRLEREKKLKKRVFESKRKWMGIMHDEKFGELYCWRSFVMKVRLTVDITSMAEEAFLLRNVLEINKVEDMNIILKWILRK